MSAVSKSSKLLQYINYRECAVNRESIACCSRSEAVDSTGAFSPLLRAVKKKVTALLD